MRCWAVIIVEQSTNTYSTLYMKIIILLHSSSYLAIIVICTQVFNIPQIKYYLLSCWVVGLIQTKVGISFKHNFKSAIIITHVTVRCCF